MNDFARPLEGMPTVVIAELEASLRRLKLGQLLDTLPDRLASAGQTGCRATTS